MSTKEEDKLGREGMWLLGRGGGVYNSSKISRQVSGPLTGLSLGCGSYIARQELSRQSRETLNFREEG